VPNKHQILITKCIALLLAARRHVIIG